MSKSSRIRKESAAYIPSCQRTGSRYVLGLMAGTSADGIDAACARIDGFAESMRIRFCRHWHTPFSAYLRRRLLSAMSPSATRTEELARLHADLGDAFAEAAYSAIKAVDRRHRPSLIGLAGQTVCHLPARGRSVDGRVNRTVTLQLGEAARVAERTGVITVADFRQSDVAAGGQGAPLVPWTDWILFRDKKVSRIIQNIGGIANVTWLPAGGGADEVIAFDTGPGNMIIDTLVKHASGGRQRMDRNGRRAARGRVLTKILDRWLKNPFFKLSPPKTTGRETFGQKFVKAELKRLQAASRSPDDWIATATAFTARSIARAYRKFLPGFGRRTFTGPDSSRSGGLSTSSHRCGSEFERSFSPVACDGAGAARGTAKRISPGVPSISVPHLRGGLPGKHASKSSELILCGGGAFNPALMAMLSAELPGLTVRPIDSLGIPVQAKEAVSFAMLAAACIDGVPANLPQVTGAKRRVVLGKIVCP